MICIKDALINSRKAPNHLVSASYILGIHNLIDEDYYLFDFLSLKNQSLDEGSFFVDGVVVAPDEDENQSLFLLKINSQNIVLSACFLLDKFRRSEQINNITESLSVLKNLPLDTIENREQKVSRILDTICSFKPSYILFDKSNPINRGFYYFVEPEFLKHQNDILIFIGDNHSDEDVLFIAEKNETVNEEKHEHKKLATKENAKAIKDKTIWFFKNFGNYFKINYLTCTFEIASILISILFILNLPFVLQKGFDSLNVVQLAGAIICIFFYFSFEFLFVDYTYKKGEDNTSLLFSIIVKTFDVIVGILLAIGLFFLFGNLNIIIKISEYHLSFAIPGIIVSVVAIFVPTIATFTHPFLNALIQRILGFNRHKK